MYQMRELEAYLEEYIFTDAKSVIAYIFKQYKVRYSLSGVTDLLHCLGFSYKKPTHVPGKQDPAKQLAFLEEYENIEALMIVIHPPAIDTYFVLTSVKKKGFTEDTYIDFGNGPHFIVDGGFVPAFDSDPVKSLHVS